jgi:hypothetical protein
MKCNNACRNIFILLLILPVVFSACVRDHCRRAHTFTYYTPVYKTRAEVRANIKSNAPRDLVNPGKLYVYGNYVFVNEIDRGVHIIDNTDPAHPRNLAFVDIPGNVDIAAKGNILYADLYTDLVALDISNPANVTVKKIVDFVFPERLYSNGFAADSSRIIAEWKKIDTTIVEDCDHNFWNPVRTDVLYASPLANAASGNSSAQPVGISGSMARFTIVNNYMYAVDHHTLRTFSISNPADPVQAGLLNAGWDIETIYPFKNKLFLGSMNGLFIFDISNPSAPVKEGEFNHGRACDPVVADNDFAYVTLRSGTTCGPTQNELQVVNVQNLQSPYLLKTYAMTNPFGLSKDNSTLFVCDGSAGLKIYEATNPSNLQLVKTIAGIEPFDVIAWNKKAIVVAKDGLYQFDYTYPAQAKLVSKLAIIK